MSAEILAQPSELRDHSAAIKSQSSDTRDEIASMRARLEGLKSQFRGQAADSFQVRWDEWSTHATGLLDALEGLGQFLDTAANVLEDVDTQLAQGLQG